MILLFDIGNTNIVLGVSDGEKILSSYRYHSLTTKTAHEFYLSMKDILNEHQYEDAVISSVVPILTSAIKKMVKDYLHIEPMILGNGLKTGIEIKTVNPKEVGADLVAASAGAYSKYNKSSVIVDLGTASKILYVEKNMLKGAIIMPGVKTSMKSLVNNTALLPSIEMAVPKNVLGTNTIDAMQSGVTYGVAASIDGLVRKIKKEVKDDFILIGTGGLSKLIIPLCEEEFILDPNLILDGLLYIYHKNK